MSNKSDQKLSKETSENQDAKKTKTGTKPFRPQVFMVGDGFPAYIQKALDILSPNPIDGVRVPIAGLLKELHQKALGVSRIGPLTGKQIDEDLKAPYATIAGNTLMAGIMIAFAQKEMLDEELFERMQVEILKELREYFDLKDLMIHRYRLSSGNIPEPANPGIPYSPEKYSPEKLVQITKDLAKLADTSREMLIAHQRERENFIQENRYVPRELIKDMPFMQSLYASAADPNDPNHKDSKERIEKVERTMVERLAAKSRPIPEKLDKEQLIKVVGKEAFEADPNRRKDLEVKKKGIQEELHKIESSKDPKDEKRKIQLEKELKWVEKDLNMTDEQIKAEMNATMAKRFEVYQVSEIATDVAAGIDTKNTNAIQDPHGVPSPKAMLEANKNVGNMSQEDRMIFLKRGIKLHSESTQIVNKQLNQVSDLSSEMTKLQNQATKAEKNIQSDNKKQS